MSSSASGFAAINGASLYYELVGDGPALVLLHGFSFDCSAWDDHIESFSAQFRVLRYDLRGFGRSQSAAVTYRHADDLKALLDFLHIDQAYLVGHSMGGGVAINFALSYPGVAKALVLVAPSLGGFKWSSEFSGGRSSILEKVRGQGLEKAREIWLRQMIFRHARGNERIAAKLRGMVGRYSGWHWLHPDLGKSLEHLAVDRLMEIAAQTLVIVGNKDIPDHLQIADLIQMKVPHAKMMVFPGVGHLVNLDEPRLFNRQVLDFLNNRK